MMPRSARTMVLLAPLLVISVPVLADIKLPAILSDGMVLQQQTDAALWGWGRVGEKVTVTASWGGEPVSVVVGDSGGWNAKLRTPAAGGPFSVTVKGDNTITLSDVMVGEVWVCSGQSNMEWNLGGIGPGGEGIPSAEAELAAAKYPSIRLYTVANTIAAQPRIDSSGSWQACTPKSAKDFSAVGYFFGRALSKQLNVPIGLISADWGGTPAESWTSAEGLKDFPEFKPALDALVAAADPAQRGPTAAAAMKAWWTGLDKVGKDAPGTDWAKPGYSDTTWRDVDVPAAITGGGLENVDGLFYLRTPVDIPSSWAAKGATLELGPIDDRDDTYFDGVLVGNTHEDGQWNTPRKYTIPASAILAGSHVIAVRVLDTGGIAGVNGKPEQVLLRSDDASLPTISLAGKWKLKPGATMKELPPMTPPSEVRPNTPSALFNGMILPLTNLAIRGAIWYQGESNVGRAAQYGKLFPAMIADWRQKWGIGDFPFLFVQIAPYQYGGAWGAAAEIREAQFMSLRVPNTGMAVTMDIGNPKDIHPNNKQQVGQRLAVWALAKTYGKADVVFSGPLYKSMEIQGDAARVSFDHADGGLVAKGGDLTHWLIAGADKVFHPAQAKVEGSVVVVRSEKVAKPVAVRYGWGDGDMPNLFNGAGLPASSFRTDDWSGVAAPVGAAPPQPAKPAAAAQPPAAGAGGDFVPLFNGKDLTGWANVNCAPGTWTVKDGMIVCSGIPTGELRTEKQYENFELELEWRHMTPKGNSGLFVWSDPLPARGQPFTRAVEVQIMDGLEGDWFTSDGDVFPIHGATMKPENGRKGGDRAFPTEKRMKPSPEWNHYRVVCNNGDISLAVNGKVVTRGHDVSPRKGYICLESEGSLIHFRNIKIRELPPSSSPLSSEQTARLAEGFRPLYNGVDFAGWKFGKAHEGHWKAQDWTISFDGQGDDLWSQESFKDFELIADWRWTAEAKDAEVPVILPNGEQDKTADGKPKTTKVKEAGDSGIYLRGSSKSQINIWCWPIGSGEVYGYRTDAAMSPQVRAGVTPKVNADAPLGEWNRFFVTMKGDRLTVVLNGKTVLENAQLPGVAAEGPIALQKHGGAIEFANIFIKELK